MKRTVLAAAVAVVVAAAYACSGSSPPGKMDAKSMLGGFGSSCTVVTNMSTECASGVCTNTINMLPTPVCSQQCNPANLGSDCPTGSMGMKCNGMGYCRP